MTSHNWRIRVEDLARCRADHVVHFGDNAAVRFSESWEVLGPFQCGTREAVWGADPLEHWGGFSNLSYDEKEEYNSPLAPGGTVKWRLVRPNVTSLCPDQSKTEIVVSFPEIDWDFLQSIYGWSALQYQAWARGTLRLNGPIDQTVAIFMDGVLEVSIDSRRHFGGDFYRYRRAPLILELAPGEHIIEIRLIRDVRVLGGQGVPAINMVFETQIQREVLTVEERSLLTPETTDQRLGSAWATVNVQTMGKPVHIAPRQIRPLIFRIAAGHASSVEHAVVVRYRLHTESSVRSRSFRLSFVDKSLSEPQRLTYLHPAGIVSYAILRPPALEAPCVFEQHSTSLPIIIGLHGAGLEADSVEVRQMLDAADGICAWMLFPSGVTSWSGDDWHTWGIADVKAAVDAISHWVEAVGWNGHGILPNDWIVVGHSNGGQGVWFLTTHQPDNVVAAAPVSGYSSIETRDLLDNTAGIPILQQHGSNDTNVPAYHSRLMHALLEETNWPSEFVELAGKGHWFDGVMTTVPLLKFYQDALHSNRTKALADYTITVPSSGDMASKGGIYVDQLQSPDLVGRVHVRRDLQHGVWYLKTQNIHRLHLTARACGAESSILLVIGERDVVRFTVNLGQCESTWYFKDAGGKWASSRQTEWQSVSQRYGRQLGAMDAILRTQGLFTIRMCSSGIGEVALQISRNLLQYFAADSQIMRHWNILTLALGNELPNSTSLSYPIRLTDSQILLYKGYSRANGRDELGLRNCHCYGFDYEPGMGALFLRPLENEGLELVVWGADIEGLEQAARLVPTITGAGQPELVILSSSCRWTGPAGLYVAAHFDYSWQISSASYIANSI
ncbi:hypothetical protein BJY00DRAFT_306106 [Aspergillus carlsbadensis]|nr:hypothetical protein BJY00DRAFT_306106 [Aspergillus carlsbadensis]